MVCCSRSPIPLPLPLPLPLPFSPAAPGRMCTHMPTNGGDQMPDYIGISPLEICSHKDNNGIHFLHNWRLQPATPWPVGIMTFCYCGNTKYQDRIMISTDIMNMANICWPLPSAHYLSMPLALYHIPHTTYHMPYIHCHILPATRLLMLGISNPAGLWIENKGIRVGANCWMSLQVSCLLRGYTGV